MLCIRELENNNQGPVGPSQRGGLSPAVEQSAIPGAFTTELPLISRRANKFRGATAQDEGYRESTQGIWEAFCKLVLCNPEVKRCMASRLQF